MAYINPETGETYSTLRSAPICNQDCYSCPMQTVANNHGVSVYTQHGMRCQDLVDVCACEVAHAFGLQKINILDETIKTTDGYYLNLIHEIPNTINSMYIYDVRGPKHYHKFLVKSAKYNASYISTKQFKHITSGILPQNYECIVDTELEAVRIADAVAMESIVEFSKSKIKTAMDALVEIEKETERVLGQKLLYMDILNRFWDNQDAMRKEKSYEK